MTKNENDFITNTLDVQWAFLHEPDTKFGKPGNHNITVVIDEELQQRMEDLRNSLGATKVNGVRQDDEGNTLLKSKTTLYTNKDVAAYPCVDAKASRTGTVAFGGDKVRLKLSPVVIDRDSSMSLFLSGVQIIEKKPYKNTGGFEETEGFDGTEYPVKDSVVENLTETAVTLTDDDLPF